MAGSRLSPVTRMNPSASRTPRTPGKSAIQHEAPRRCQCSASVVSSSKSTPLIAKGPVGSTRWKVAQASGETLPAAADAPALNAFLMKRQQAAPAQFPDLSLAIVKLLGAGEYVLKRAGQPAEGHFGLAVDDYTHATAPNRRYPDVITQRLLKAALAGQPAPYGDDELRSLGTHCTDQEGNAAKVEDAVTKIVAAIPQG